MIPSPTHKKMNGWCLKVCLTYNAFGNSIKWYDFESGTIKKICTSMPLYLKILYINYMYIIYTCLHVQNQHITLIYHKITKWNIISSVLNKMEQIYYLLDIWYLILKKNTRTRKTILSLHYIRITFILSKNTFMPCLKSKKKD